ncbi:MAG: FAD-dependent oxidoreductase [Deltaproteobacteria bacterium]|nr:FAD-dependent oxidoreductase [Deltaproteobacteria bacterium]
MASYEAIIIGAGPAGLFAALSLENLGAGRVLLVEQGPDLTERRREQPGGLLCGWGGAGAYSDGKLILSPEVGGFLSDLLPLDDLTVLIQEVDGIYQELGAPPEIHGGDLDTLELLKTRARHAGMIFIPTRLRHIGTDNCRTILTRLRERLTGRVEIRTRCRARRIVVEEGAAAGVALDNNEVVRARYVIAAPGRSGAAWIREEARRLAIPSVPSPVDIGVRVEVPAAVLAPLTEAAYEAKLIYYSRTFDDKVRTFCMNPHGEVVLEDLDGLVTVNGHSYTSRKTENSNFAILVSSTFTHPFDDPISYGQYIARLANLLGQGALVQRLGDLQVGRRTTVARLERCLTRPTLKSATPGDLSFVLPYRYLKDILEMLEALDALAPGINSRHTLLYGMEVKFYSHRFQLSPELETPVRNLFIIGDGAGITRGLIQASASGLIAARALVGRG